MDAAGEGDILTLATPIYEEAHIKYVTLPTGGEPTQPGSHGTMAGWGKLAINKPTARRLQKTDIEISQLICFSVHISI